MSVKLLTEHHLELLSLKGDCTGSSDSTLVKMPNRWKSHGSNEMKKTVEKSHSIPFCFYSPQISGSVRTLFVLLHSKAENT